jgi:hypothetical protein
MSVTGAPDFATGTQAAVVRRFSGCQRVVTIRNAQFGAADNEAARAAAVARLEGVQRLASWILE